MSQIEQRLTELGITLPQAAPAAANYVPFVISANQLFVAGQLPTGPDGLGHTGKLGDELLVDEGRTAARLCGLNILAQAKAALGDLDRIARIVKLGGFVNCVPGFTDHPQVVNGASDLMVDVFGDKGRHTRFAVGCAGLPFDAAVEVDAIIEIG